MAAPTAARALPRTHLCQSHRLRGRHARGRSARQVQRPRSSRSRRSSSACPLAAAAAAAATGTFLTPRQASPAQTGPCLPFALVRISCIFAPLRHLLPGQAWLAQGLRLLWVPRVMWPHVATLSTHDHARMTDLCTIVHSTGGLQAAPAKAQAQVAGLQQALRQVSFPWVAGGCITLLSGGGCRLDCLALPCDGARPQWV
jgi:hypothetical protein